MYVQYDRDPGISILLSHTTTQCSSRLLYTDLHLEGTLVSVLIITIRYCGTFRIKRTIRLQLHQLLKLQIQYRGSFKDFSLNGEVCRKKTNYKPRHLIKGSLTPCSYFCENNGCISNIRAEEAAFVVELLV